LAAMAALAAVPLVVFNLWSTSEYVSDQMLGRQQLQEQLFKSDQHVAEMSNDVIRWKREVKATRWPMNFKHSGSDNGPTWIYLDATTSENRHATTFRN
jgi:hypothetical protein